MINSDGKGMHADSIAIKYGNPAVACGRHDGLDEHKTEPQGFFQSCGNMLDGIRWCRHDGKLQNAPPE